MSPVDVRNAGEIERGVTALAKGVNGGLIVTGMALGMVHGELITTLAARHKLPAVYSSRFYVTGGGLISYAPDQIDREHHVADGGELTGTLLDPCAQARVVVNQEHGRQGFACVLPRQVAANRPRSGFWRKPSQTWCRAPSLRRSISFPDQAPYRRRESARMETRLLSPRCA